MNLICVCDKITFLHSALKQVKRIEKIRKKFSNVHTFYSFTHKDVGIQHTSMMQMTYLNEWEMTALICEYW